MSAHPAFELLRDEAIAEVNSRARLYRHKKTGAEVLTLANDDENKVFGITFKTPPEDSTGVAHILEHSVLCGSRKYPVKEPFVELLKGSLHTFLNAMTFPDKTVYPVASQNLKDFYNLVDVYLDAVLFPLISENTFRQEGWHFELDSSQGPLTYKGVVFNEMKGAYSSPASVLGRKVQQTLYPDTTYGVDSGGDPAKIPDLTYTYFKNFHDRFYHPSNSRIVFYGDDPEEQRLEKLEEFLGQFDRIEPNSAIGLQPRFSAPKHITGTYAAGEEEAEKPNTAMVSVNWMLDPTADQETAIILALLEFSLVGTSAAPLRKALTDSGLGEGLTSSGIADDYRQPMFSVGLKGVEAGNAPKVEALILDTLQKLARDGIDKETVAAAVNTLEFQLRENNTGSFPRGIALIFRAMRTWLHEGDPLEPLYFEAALGRIKERLANGEKLFETVIGKQLLDNPHRTTVLLTADPEQGEREAAQERARLDAIRGEMSETEVADVMAVATTLKSLQEAVDPPEELAKIPTLHLSDLPRENKITPSEESRMGETRVLFHDLKTSGVVYLDLAFDIHGLDPALLPYFPLFTRALTQTGTAKEDFVSLSQRIGRSTGGIGAGRHTSGTFKGKEAAAYLLVRGKSVPDQTGELLAIATDILLTPRLDNKERIRQMVLEEKAGFESRLSGMGNSLASMRVKANFHEADWLAEQLSGVTHLFFLRQLVTEIDADWPAVAAKLEAIRETVVNRAGLVANITTDRAEWEKFAPELAAFLAGLPSRPVVFTPWPLPEGKVAEGLTIPAQVNFVAKGANILNLGYTPSGATAVAMTSLNTGYLWDKVRVQGGAYGSGTGFTEVTGSFVFTSYRDPNLLQTLDIYDQASGFLRREIEEAELTRSIIGVIGRMDGHQLPDAKGYSALIQTLIGESHEHRQQRRDEVLGAKLADFRALADVLAQAAKVGQVAVVGSEAAIKAANDERSGFLKVTRVL
ncbi:MAG TPA: insulinase family protein [Devosiaceae bacterium]|nr:insulinase family protein [Devosiaceae bacterium]